MFDLFNLSLRLNGFPMKEATTELEKISAVSETDYENYINNKKKKIVEFHLKRFSLIFLYLAFNVDKRLN